MQVTINKKEIEAPKCLKKEGKSFYRQITEGYDLEAHHLEILKQACTVLDEIKSAENELKQAKSRYFIDRYGQPREHPASADLKQLRGLFQRLLRELNLDAGAIPEMPRR